MNKPTIAKAEIIVDARGIKRDFPSGIGVVHALCGIDLAIHAGEFVALRGRSGSGKTTFLNILIGLDLPTQGTVSILGHLLGNMGEDERAQLRREHIGMMFQNAHLFSSLTAIENVEIPLRLKRIPFEKRMKQAQEALELVGLGKRLKHRATELSGGEQQRVALARAFVHHPRFIVADEPTGNLDSLTGRDITNLLRRISHEQNIGLLIATHDPIVFKSADRIIHINDGLLIPHDEVEPLNSIRT